MDYMITATSYSHTVNYVIDFGLKPLIDIRFCKVKYTKEELDFVRQLMTNLDESNFEIIKAMHGR
jgi:hypothetical protein